MYSSTIIINKKKFKGILDFGVLKQVQEDLAKLGFEYKIPELFENLSDFKNIDMNIVMSILLFSISRYNNIDNEEIESEFMKEILDLDKFNKLFEYINSLFEKCMPKNENNEELFEFEDDEIKEKEDWNFPYMEYLWYSVLKRNDNFYSITPKTFFSQMEIYKSVNNIKEENVDYL